MDWLWHKVSIQKPRKDLPNGDQGFTQYPGREGARTTENSRINPRNDHETLDDVAPVECAACLATVDSPGQRRERSGTDHEEDKADEEEDKVGEHAEDPVLAHELEADDEEDWRSAAALDGMGGGDRPSLAVLA